ncbi:hypothetical protein [Rhizobium rhizogenes]|uniref:hypothetical protein n=1 Tax=Rhizobium rhizogenes TaxID=359 RepID=UPI0005AAB7DD|nr:hypothetical protein [Rhizobium rhizogenes]NTG68246.1 hypothetical protein [Rhizobium rhizogenes]NTI69065.1 hypothetical protein [Rhizobium rhizogenes]TRB12889.1 hypothetical protein EXN67_09475 [Rhizobium rhizogenes]TRB37452.1 hypothetical protein EXN73_30905 [Rhizobium rhizogenes]TRB52238.1 hypothetical protein EXN71_31345 [Rhizobium rhizogenes]
MPTTIADLAEGWKRSRDALQDQVNLMDRDPIFPEATLSPAQRNGLRSEIELIIHRYDQLILQHSRR